MINGRFTTIVYHLIIFNESEIKKVILRCLTSLNLNWFKSYDKKDKCSLVGAITRFFSGGSLALTETKNHHLLDCKILLAK